MTILASFTLSCSKSNCWMVDANEIVMAFMGLIGKCCIQANLSSIQHQKLTPSMFINKFVSKNFNKYNLGSKLMLVSNLLEKEKTSLGCMLTWDFMLDEWEVRSYAVIPICPRWMVWCIGYQHVSWNLHVFEVMGVPMWMSKHYCWVPIKINSLALTPLLCWKDLAKGGEGHTLEENLCITTFCCNLAIATHGQKMHK